MFLVMCAMVHLTLKQQLEVFLRLSDSLFQVLPFFLLVPCLPERLLLGALFPLQHWRNIFLWMELAGGQIIVYTKKKRGGSPKPSYCIQKATWEHLMGFLHSGQAVVAQWTLYMVQEHSRRECHVTVRSDAGCRSAKTNTNHQLSFLPPKNPKPIYAETFHRHKNIIQKLSMFCVFKRQHCHVLSNKMLTAITNVSFH